MRAWRFSSGGRRSARADERTEGLVVGGEDRADRDFFEADAEAPGELAGVAKAALRRIGARHGHAQDLARPEGFDRERRDHRGVDPARKTEDGAPESALAGVVREGEDERAPQSGNGGELGRGRAAAPGDLDRPEVFLETAGGADQPALRVEGRRGAVEDQAVVSADEVAVHEGNPRAPGDPLHHAATQAILAERVGRRRDVDVEVEAERRELGHRIGVVERPPPECLVVPDVLADRDGHAPARDAQDERAVARLDVPALVEDVVGGEQALAVEGDALSSARGDGGIEDAPAAGGTVGHQGAEDPGRLPGGAGDPIRRALARRNEGGALDEVSRRIAANGELGEEDEIGARGFGAAAVVHDLGRVALEVADGHVDLRDGHLQRRTAPSQA